MDGEVVLTRFCNNERCPKNCVPQKTKLYTKNCPICQQHLFKSKNEDHQKWNSALGIAEPHTDPETFLSPAPWLAPRVICSGMSSVDRSYFEARQDGDAVKPKEKFSPSEPLLGPPEPSLGDMINGLQGTQPSNLLQNKRYIHVRVRPRCPSQVSTPDIPDVLDDLARPCFAYPADPNTCLGREETHLDRGPSAELSERCTSKTPSRAAKRTKKRAAVLISVQTDLPQIADHSNIFKETENGGAIVPVKSCLMSEDAVLEMPKRDRDGLSWGRGCRAAARLGVHVAKRVSSLTEVSDHSSGFRCVSTVNLLNPSSLVRLARLPPSADSSHGRSSQQPHTYKASGQAGKTTGLLSPQPDLHKHTSNAVSLAFHRVSARPDPNVIEAGRLAAIPRENPFRRFRSESPAQSVSQGMSLDVVGSGVKAHKPVVTVPHNAAPHLQEHDSIAGAHNSNFKQKIDSDMLPLTAAANDGSGNPGESCAESATGLLPGQQRLSASLHACSACSAPSLDVSESTTLSTAAPGNAAGDPHDNVDDAAVASQRRGLGRMPVKAGRQASVEARRVAEQSSLLPIGRRRSSSPQARQDRFRDQASKGKGVSSDLAGTTAGVVVAASAVGGYSAEIVQAMHAAQRLVDQGRAQDARRVEGRRQRAGHNVERLEEMAKSALLRLAKGRLGAAWHHWSEAVQEAHNIRLLLGRTQSKPVQQAPQMRPRLRPRQLLLAPASSTLQQTSS